jgi:hypothetical protein
LICAVTLVKPQSTMNDYAPSRRRNRPRYQINRGRLLDLFPGNRPGAMVFAELVACQQSDEPFSNVASEYRRLSLRERSRVSVQELCERAGIEPQEFTSRIVACGLSCGLFNMSAVPSEIVGGPARIMNLIGMSLGTGPGAQ